MAGGTAGRWLSPRRWALALLVLAVLAVAAVAVRLAPLFLSPNAYAGVPSIEREPAYRDPALMRAAWSRPVAVRYRRLPFEYQHNQSVCAPTSVADVLHSLGDASSQEAVLAGAHERTWFGYLIGGMTLDQLGTLLSERIRRPVRVVRGLDLPRFRAAMRLLDDPRYRVIANFHRGPMFGRGHGHFSPLLGYLPARDLVLVGDVNATYRPYLVSTARLWRGVDTVDPDSGRKRGLAVVRIG